MLLHQGTVPGFVSPPEGRAGCVGAVSAPHLPGHERLQGSAVTSQHSTE